MEYFYNYLYVFLVGGFVCLIGQILIITTQMTTARILVCFELLGVLLEAVGVYEYIYGFAKSGISIPIIGFGASLAKGAIKAVKSKGLIGIFTGGLEATAGGIAAAIIFAFIISLIFRPKTKKS
ncbi:MAG: SpoVA/SpoVAEb family sporulation membrane protein [Clostridia bacterium]|nr:SpoVA/SpoVAEb family sporulation membrane protein [Clostridia bacterium]